ncbi:MAG: FHA domain-containing protein [Clostridium sp.]|nr:FHA domain-containing protein [Clostridium sp.]
MKRIAIDSRRFLAAFLGALFLAAGTAAGAEPGAVINGGAFGEQIILYVQSPGEVDDISCQIGTALCGEIAWKHISQEETPVKTYLLVDNSLSVSQKYRPMINEIMNNLAANRMPGEEFTVATFSDKITYLIEDSGDYARIKEAVDGISYEDQETYLTDVLYELLEAWNREPSPVLKRIVIVSDGVDNKTMGYTKEELYGLLKEHPYPIYTLGCADKSNSNGEALKNMSALSRLTQAEAWLLDDVGDSMAVVQGVAGSNDVIRVEITVPAELRDGADKGVKLTLQAGGEVLEASTVVSMPFGAADGRGPEETEAPVSRQEEDEEARAQERASLEAEKLEAAKILRRKKLFTLGAAGCAAFLIAAALTVVIVRALTLKKKENEFETAPESAAHEYEFRQGPVRSVMDETEMAGSGGRDGEQTAMVWGNNERAYTLVLTDQDHPGKTFEVPLNGSVVVGRSRKDGCQVVLDYERSVSHCHCKISVENGQMRVTDLGSKNGTIVNGKRVVGTAAVAGGSILTLGNLRLKVELR